MITCQNARDLFDRYLDGALSPSLQTELHAHCLHCPWCQNELAMLETCGEVIALDRGEPRLSGAFTDRVLAARRRQLAERPRRWGRMVLYGSPLAAAASLVFTILLVAPGGGRLNEKVVSGEKVAAPKAVQQVLAGIGKTQLTPAAQKELEQTPENASAGPVNELLAAWLAQSRSTLERTLQNTEALKLLLGDLTGNNRQLMDLWKATQVDKPAEQPPAETPGADWNWWELPSLNTEEPAESSGSEVLEAL